jgi:SAM-dependent methyltransferase
MNKNTPVTIQNIYDDPEFFAGYKHLRDTRSGLNEVLEQPALRALLPELGGLAVLELGCGMGAFARYCAEQGGARRVVGVEVSERMLEVARQQNAHERVVYVQAPMETVSLPEASFDLAVSSLALHYIGDYAAVVRRVHSWLKPGGLFVFSVEHPLVTAQAKMQGWVKDDEGRKSHWPVDDYGTEGRREQHWFVDGVVKYHRRVSTLLNGLTDAGFAIEQVEEPEATSEAWRQRPDLQEESRRPPFLLVRARHVRAG